MQLLDTYKYRILPHLNLILVFPVIKSGDVIRMMQKMNDVVFADPEYRDNMNAIVQYQETDFPKNEIFYNDLDKNIFLSVKTNIYVDIFNENEKHMEKFSKVFNIFAKQNSSFSKKVCYSYSVQEAISILGLHEHSEIIKQFFSEKPTV